MKGFYCYFCGRTLSGQAGDRWRWVCYSPVGPYKEPFAPFMLFCDRCDGPDVRERWKADVLTGKPFVVKP